MDLLFELGDTGGSIFVSLFGVLLVDVALLPEFLHSLSDLGVGVSLCLDPFGVCFLQTLCLRSELLGVRFLQTL